MGIEHVKMILPLFKCKHRQTKFRPTKALPVFCALYDYLILRGMGGGLAVYVESEYLFPIFCRRQYLFLSNVSTDHLFLDIAD